MRRSSAKKTAKSKRDDPDGPILLIPLIVFMSDAYIFLSDRAKTLLIDIAMQYNKNNNGKLLASIRYMKTRGWNSSDSLNKAIKELIIHGLLVQTVQGGFPNKASWYGLTWLKLDAVNNIDISAKCWARGAYHLWKQDESINDTKRKPPKKETREKHYQSLRQRRGGALKN